MDELSLYVLDITMNSVRAGATEISVTLCEAGDWLDFTVTDNGCGMTEEQVKRLTDPFFTTRKTRKVGLGIPFLTMLAEMTGGGVEIQLPIQKQTVVPTIGHPGEKRLSLPGDPGGEFSLQFSRCFRKRLHSKDGCAVN